MSDENGLDPCPCCAFPKIQQITLNQQKGFMALCPNCNLGTMRSYETVQELRTAWNKREDHWPVITVREREEPEPDKPDDEQF